MTLLDFIVPALFTYFDFVKQSFRSKSVMETKFLWAMWIAVLERSFKVETFCYLTFSNSWRTWRGCLDAGEPSFYPFHWMLSFPNRPNTFTRHYLQGECQCKKRCWRWWFFLFHFHGSLTSGSNRLFWPLMPLTCLRFCFLHLLCYLKTIWKDSL